MSHASGTIADFETLIRPELQRLYRLAYRLAGTVADAEDLVQDVLVKVYERRTELTSIVALRPWLARVLYNQFIDSTRRHPRRHLRSVALNDGSEAGDLCDTLQSNDPGPRQALEREFDIKALSRALQALSLEHRSVLLMHDSEGYKLTEIHTITGIPVGTLKSRLHRARARVRELLAADGTF